MNAGQPTTTANAAASASQTRVRTPWREFWRKFKKQHIAMVAGAFVLALVIIAILAPHLVPFDPENYFDYDALNAGPSATHWFGVDCWGATSSAACWRAHGFRWPPGSDRSPSVR